MESLKVLVVDDEPDMAEFVSDALESLGHEPTTAGDKGAFSKVYKDGYDVVMLDLYMPDADGIDLLRLLSDAKCGAFVVFMSGKDRSILNAAQRLAQAQGVGVLGTLQKPFTVDELGAVTGRYGDMVRRTGKPSPFKPGAEEMSRALAEGQFALCFRPQTDVDMSTVIGGDASLVWKHPSRGDIEAERFMPMAEEYGLYNPMIEFALTRMIGQLGAWNRAGRPMRLSLRMTPKALVEIGIAERLEHLIRSNEVNADQVVIGIPETSLSDGLGDCYDLLTRLRIKRFNLSIDGFGIGRTSLYQLVRVPFNELKFDRSVVEGMVKDPEIRAFARIVIMVAHELDIRVTATGVRDEGALRILAEMKCDYVQGELVGEPMEAAVLPSETSPVANLSF